MAGVIYLADQSVSAKIFAAIDDLIKTSTQFVASIAAGNHTNEEVAKVLHDVRTLVMTLIPEMFQVSVACDLLFRHRLAYSPNQCAH